MNRSIRNIIVAGLLIAAFYIVIRGGSGMVSPSQASRQIAYSRLLEMLDAETVLSGYFEKDIFTLETLSGKTHTVILPDVPDARAELIKRLEKQRVTFEFRRSPWSDMLQSILPMLLPMAVIILFWVFLLRQMQSGNSQAMAFGRSKARRAGDGVPKVTFADVAGVDEAKQELEEIVDFLKAPKKYSALGAKIPRGVLLLGPPGCGKTLLARAVAGEAGVPFFHISGSDFVEMFVGVGAARVRDLFDTAKANRPCLVFVDEIDAVGRQRGAGLGGGHDEREQTLNQMLVEMDGFDPNSGVILLAATNRPDVLDPALLRPGRFDRHITVDPPDQKGREAILRVHMKEKPVSDDVDPVSLARRTPGFSGADLANLVNEAALMAARYDRKTITMAEFESAVDRVVAGPERRSRLVDQTERMMVAYHEVGHALAGELVPLGDPVHKVSILPRGMALGLTMFLPERDKYLVTRAELLDRITAMLGGRAAETLIYNEATTGANNDLARSTEMARAMVCEYGMSDRLGNLTFGRRHGNPFLGRDIMEDRNYSEQVAFAIDEEVSAIVSGCFDRAKRILADNREILDRITEVLVDKETIDRDEFLALAEGAVHAEPMLHWHAPATHSD